MNDLPTKAAAHPVLLISAYGPTICPVTQAEIPFFFFWPCPWHVEVPGPGIQHAPQQKPAPLQ